MSVCFPAGMIKVENERPCHSTEIVLGQTGIQQTPIFYSFPSRYKLAYMKELEHFLDVVQRKSWFFLYC